MSKEAELHCDYKSTDGRSVRVLCAELDAKEVYHQLTQLLVSVCAHISYKMHVFKDLTIESGRRMLQGSHRCRNMQNFSLILNLLMGVLSLHCVQS